MNTIKLLKFMGMILVSCIVLNEEIDADEPKWSLDSSHLQQPWQESNHCGVNCLYFMLQINNVPASYDEIVRGSELTRLGSSMQDLHTLGVQKGLPNRVVRAVPESLDRVPLPAIAHISSDEDEGHYVIILNIQHENAQGKNGTIAPRISIIDGTSCRVEVRDLGSFLRSWTGYLIVKDEGWPDQTLSILIYWLFGILATLVLIYIGVVSIDSRKNRPNSTQLQVLVK